MALDAFESFALNTGLEETLTDLHRKFRQQVQQHSYDYSEAIAFVARATRNVSPKDVSYPEQLQTAQQAYLKHKTIN